MRLRELRLSVWPPTTSVFDAIVALPALERLQVEVDGVGEDAVLTDDHLRRLVKPRLRELVLDMCADVTDSGLEALSACSALEVLSLHAPRIGERGVAALATLPRLRALSLSGRFGDLAAARLARSHGLVELFVHSPALTRDVVPTLTALPLLERLRIETPGVVGQELGPEFHTPPFWWSYGWNADCGRCDHR